MTDERRETLAEQAAAWVPPWLREQPAGSGAERPDSPPPAPAPRESAEVAAFATAATRSRTADLTTPDSTTPDSPAADLTAAEPSEPTVAESTVAAAVADPAAVEESAAAEEEATAGQETLALLDDRELRAALEAILLVVDEPVSEVVLAQVLEQPTERIAGMLERLADDYTSAGRGFELRRAAGGWRLYTRPEYAPYVERFVLDGQSVRLTQAALETLAVIAYKQPVTRSRISAIRGVNCDGVVRTLLSRGLIEECGTEPETGAHLYRTTNLFLEKLGLDSLDQLPPLAPLLPENLEEIPDGPR